MAEPRVGAAMSCELGGLLNEKETTLSPGASLSPPSERHMGHQERTCRGRGSWGLLLGPHRSPSTGAFQERTGTPWYSWGARTQRI